MALAGIKEGRQSRYKTTCLLIILMLFSVFRQFGKLEVVNFLYIFDQCQESYLLTDIALLSCEDYIYLLTPQSYSSWVIDGESQCSLDFPNCQSIAQFPHLLEGKNNHI